MRTVVGGTIGAQDEEYGFEVIALTQGPKHHFFRLLRHPDVGQHR